MSHNDANTRKKKKLFFEHISGFGLAMIIVMLVFFIVGASTMGVFNSSGKSYHAQKEETVVFFLDYDQNAQSGLAQIYLNVGTIFVQPGMEGSLKMEYSSGSTSNISWSSGSRMGTRKIANLYSNDSENVGADVPLDKRVFTGANYNWVSMYQFDNNTLSTTYRLIRLTASQEMLINEVVFLHKEGKVIPAYTDADQIEEQLHAKYSEEQYPIVKQLFRENSSTACNLIDRQNNVSSGNSWRTTFTDAEIYTLMQFENMFLGHSASQDSYYPIDSDFGSLGTIILSLGVFVFGKSTFGLRFMPLLCTTLLIGLLFLFARRLFKSEGFGFLTGLLFAIGGTAFTVGRTGLAIAPLALLMVGCYYLMYRFYARGIRTETPLRSSLNVLFSGLCFAGAFSIWANSWMIALGAVALFAFGVLRMFRRQRIAEEEISGAVREKNARETDPSARAANLEQAEAEQAKSAARFAYNLRVAIVFFAAAFLLGTLIVLVLSALPSYLSYVRHFDTPAEPKLGFFTLLGKMIAGTCSVTNFTVLTRENAANAFSWLVGYKGATLFTASDGEWYRALNVQNNILMTFSALVGFVISTIYVVVYFVVGGKDNPEYRKHFHKIGRSYLVITCGSFLTLLACAVIPQMSAVYSMLFYAFYLGYIPLTFFIMNAHDTSKPTVLFGKIALNRTMKVLTVAVALYAILCVASLPMYFAFGVPASLAHGLFGWTSLANNGFYR